MEFRTKKEITCTPIEDVVRLQVAVSRAVSERLANEAYRHKTTSAEIVRVAIEKILQEIELDP